MYHIVYLTTNTLNGKIYIGVHSTEDLDDGYLGSGHGIMRALKKHGRHNFVRQILHHCLTDVEAYTIEESIVDADFIKRRDTYNHVTGGQASGLGRKYSDESKQQMSKSASARIRKPHSEETKLKMSQTQQNKTAEQKAEIAKKLSKVNKGLKRSAEQCERLSKLHKGKIMSQETRDKISTSSKGRIFSDATGAKISANQRKTYTLLLEHTNETLCVDNIKEWCSNNSLSFCMIDLTFKKDRFYKGYKIISKTGGNHFAAVV